MKKIIVTVSSACFACAVVFGSASNKTIQSTNLLKSNIESQTAYASAGCDCMTDWVCIGMSAPCGDYGYFIW